MIVLEIAGGLVLASLVLGWLRSPPRPEPHEVVRAQLEEHWREHGRPDRER